MSVGMIKIILNETVIQSRVIPKLIYLTPSFLFLTNCSLTFLTASGTDSLFKAIMANKGHNSASTVSFLLPFHTGTWMQFSNEPAPPSFSLSSSTVSFIYRPMRSRYFNRCPLFYVYENGYIYRVMPVQPRGYMTFWVQQVDYFVYLGWEHRGKCY